MLNKAIFLDRDGVINKKAAEHEYVTSWNDFQFLPGVLTALRNISATEYIIIIITNQRGISLGKMSEDNLNDIHDNMIKKINEMGGRIDRIYFCPHGIGECDCRKPSLGMIKMAKRDFDIDLKNSWMIGDSASDILLGKSAGCKTIFIGKSNLFNADRNCENLSEFVDILLG